MNDIENLVNYVTTTPNNTNKQIVRHLANQIANSSGTGKGIKVVDLLPETAEDGDLCLIASNIGNQAKTAKEIWESYFENNFSLEDLYHWYAVKYGKTYSDLTEEDKTDARENICGYIKTWGRDLERLFEDGEIEEAEKSLVVRISPAINKNIPVLTLSDIVEEGDNYSDTGNGKNYSIKELYVNRSSFEPLNEDYDFASINIIPLGPENNFSIIDDGKGDIDSIRKYPKYKDGYVRPFCNFIIQSSENTDELIFIPNINIFEGD